MHHARPSIAHILPGMHFGGVEVAILKSYKELNKDFDYNVYFVRKRGELDVGQSPLISLLKLVFIQRTPPDLVLSSLWWAHIFGFFLSLTGIRWACFIHSTGHSSVFDFIFTRLALWLCSNQIFDSETSKAYFGAFKSRFNYVVPYVFMDEDGVSELNTEPDFTFSWIGRNSKEKRPDLVVKFIQSLRARSVPFSFHICIAGDRNAALDELANELTDSLLVEYNVPPEAIFAANLNSQMTICLSDYEGFSVTTAEAAMRGNLICARRVGELSHYLCERSTIWLDDLSENSWNQFMEQVVACLKDRENLLSRRQASKRYSLEALREQSYVAAISTGFKALTELE